MKRLARNSSRSWLVAYLATVALTAFACSDNDGAPSESPAAAGTQSGTAGMAQAGSGASAGEQNAGTGGSNTGAGAGGSGGESPDDAHDIVIYGCTSAGIVAAVQAVRMEQSVIVVCPEQHLGGLSASGLGWTDSGDKSVIGGLSRDFYRRLKTYYDSDDAWQQQDKADYSHYVASDDAMWVFEPHVAEQVFEDLVDEFAIDVRRDEWLDREQGVSVEGARITSITTLSGAQYSGKIFIDASYEGDLMAAAGVSYAVGRESNATYGETLNGVQTQNALEHQFTEKISPYVIADDPASGLLPRVSAEPPGEDGSGDARIQAYNYRVCLTNAAENRIPFAEPDGYDPLQYELLLRTLLAGSRHVFGKFDPAPNLKTDTNNSGSFSTDNVGMNYAYPEASYEEREAILLEHQTYQKGYFYFLANDPRVPEDVRSKMSEWGLPADEFTDNGGWPHQIYVREARRLVSDFVTTENHLRGLEQTPEPIGMGSYNMDSHNTQRYVVSDPAGDYVWNEGDVQVDPGGPYPISYRAIVPQRAESENLLVPVCASTSHIAYGSIRMEPVFMILGQSAATAAALALDAGVAVQDVDYQALRAQLHADGQVLGIGLEPEDFEGVVVDDVEAELVGDWTPARASTPFIAAGYLHDGNAGKGGKSARFVATLPSAGQYEVRLAYSSHTNRASNVPVVIEHAGGTANVSVNQTLAPSIDDVFHSLGAFDFDTSAAVEVTTTGTDGYVIVDAVQFVEIP